MNLSLLLAKLENRFDLSLKKFSWWQTLVTGQRNRVTYFYGEGLISYTWQVWCHFCREVILNSCLGCQTANGTTLACTLDPPTWQRFSYIASQVRYNRKINETKANISFRFEPTWGDVGRCGDVIKAINPQNAPTLSSAFGAMTAGSMHLQEVRNAAAHVNRETYKRVRNLAPYYQCSPIRHPVEAMLWTDLVIQDFAFIAWIEEMRTVAQLAVQ